VPDYDTILDRAWKAHTRAGEAHPLIEVLLGDNERTRRHELEAGIAALQSGGAVLDDYACRIVSASIAGFDCAIAALTELFVGGRFALARGRVRFIPRGPSPSHEFTATRTGATIAVEVQSVMSPGTLRAQHRDLRGKFIAQRGRKQFSPELRGHTMKGKGLSLLALSDQPLGSGTTADQIRNLVGKKKPGRQLKGAANSVLVMSFWHKWGIGRAYCQRIIPSGTTGVLYAATYGRAGDSIVDFDTANERGRRMRQPTDGILVRSGSVAAVVWVFQAEAPVVFENLDRRRAALSTPARRLLLDAFGIPGDPVSKLRP
jgi:hypothetical protein